VAALLVSARNVGTWLIQQDPPAQAEVIVVLGGGMPYRAEEAGRLFKLGEAREVWLTRPANPADELKKFGIVFTGEEEYGRQVLGRLGVPDSSIRILTDSIINTEQEITEIDREMRKSGKSRVIIVTSPQHTRRVRALWTKLAAAGHQAVIRAAFQDPFDAQHWWWTTRDTFAVVRELLGMVNAWIGLPVRPASN
jgi:hypothetical protein